MTSKDKIARRKLSLLELAADLSNVSRACKVMGYSRQQFYEIRRNFQTYGAEGLVDRLPGARGRHPNRVSAEIEQVVPVRAGNPLRQRVGEFVHGVFDREIGRAVNGRGPHSSLDGMIPDQAYFNALPIRMAA